VPVGQEIRGRGGCPGCPGELPGLCS
jgi:hypothetical protein